jgi:DNA-directed RNA polymerase subunit M/transcription elongation factor TFIIS
VIACPNCRTLLSAEIANTGRLYACPNCGTHTRADLYNAFHRPVDRGQNGEAVQVQGEAECFYHPGKKAVAACSGCGRLLCALCEIDWDSRILCTRCLQAGRQKQQIQTLERGRTHYDSIALHLAFWPLIIWPFTIITAPAVIFVVLRYWKHTKSIVPRSRYRHVLAFLLAGGQISGWVFFFSRLLI